MKQRLKGLLALTLSLVMMLGMVTVGSASMQQSIASTSSYRVYVGGTQVTSDNAADVLGDSKVSYDAANNTLTLNGANISTHRDSGIEARGDLTIMLNGTNTVTCTDSGGEPAVSVGGALTIVEDETSGVQNRLTTSSEYGDGISAEGITISGGVVEAIGNRYGVNAEGITISDGSVSAEGNDVGIFTYEIAINGGSVIAAGNGADGCGISASMIAISNGSVEATGDDYGIDAYEITINNGTLTATGGNYGINAGECITISGGVVEAEGDDCGIYVFDSSSSGGTLVISGGTVEAEGGTWATYAGREVSVDETGYTNGYQWTTDSTGATAMIKSTDADGFYHYSYSHKYLKIEPLPAALSGTVTITGETKFGSTLTAQVENSNNTGELSYQWYRGGVKLIDATGKTYTLVQNDLNEKMKVVVTSSVQTGSIESAQTAVVEKADRLDVPTGLAGVAPTTVGGSDGKITGTTSAMEYSTYSDFHSSTACGENETRISHGTYYVRYRETDTYNAGTNYATVVVPDCDPPAPMTYTVTFDANGGSGTMDAMTNEASVEFTYPACTFTAPAGKRFKGWSTDAESIEVIPVGTKHNLNGGDHLSLYAIWETIEDSTQQPADTYTISGTVVEKATAEPVTGAEVALKLGTTLIATETTDENGLFYFGGQKAGDYNVVVTSGDKVVTVLVALHDYDEDGLTVELPQTVTNSIVVHKTSEGFAAGTLVGRLDKVAQDLRKELGIATATDIEVKLTVADQKTSDIGENVQKAIKKEASGKELLFFDLSVWKKIGTEQPKYMSKLDSLLEIYILFDGSDKENVMVYRYHDNGAEVLPSVNKDSDREGYWVGDDGYIHILTNHFSTYAIGYTEKSDSQPSYNYPIYVAPVEDEAEQIASPQTFDAGITLPVVVTILGATGSAWLLRKKDD